jgi:hypothetical protein
MLVASIQGVAFEDATRVDVRLCLGPGPTVGRRQLGVAAVDESTLVEARGTPDNTKIDVDAAQDHQKNERQPIQKGAPTGKWLSADGGGLVELAAEVTRSPGINGLEYLVWYHVAPQFFSVFP